MRILYDNKIKTSVLTRSSERSAYPISNLQIDHLSKWFKTQSASDEWIKIAGSVTATYICILNHNLTAGATVTLEGNSSDDWSSPDLSVTLDPSDEIIISDFTSATYNFWRITFTDAANPDGYIRIGGLFLGVHLQFPGMKIDQEIIDNTTTSIDYSASRQLYADLGIDYKDFSINFPFISTTQRDNIRAMWNTVGKHTPVIALIWETDLDLQLPIYCHLTEPIRWKRNESPNFPWGTTMRFSEVF